MIIDFGKISENGMQNFKGGCKSVGMKAFSDNLNRIMMLRLEPGASIGLHTHQTNSEIMLMLHGNGHIIYDDVEFDLHEGECHYCPKGHTHSLLNNSDSDIVVYAVVAEQ